MPFRFSMFALGGAFVAALFITAGCSQNAGFGAPPAAPYPGPQSSGAQTAGSPGPQGSGFAGLGSNGGSPNPNASASPTLGIAGASARYAYDGSNADPVGSGRLLELAFAVRNGTNTPVVITKVTATLDKDAIGDASFKVGAGANATSDVAMVAFKPKKDLTSAKQINLAFLDDAGKIALQTNVELPPPDLTFVPLDEKDPKGGTTIDGVEVSSIATGEAGLHYEITFALTNAGTTKVTIDGFMLTVPKGAAQKVHLALVLPPRTTTGFISVIMPFKGKALPNGDYLISAQSGSNQLAKSSGALL